MGSLKDEIAGNGDQDGGKALADSMGVMGDTADKAIDVALKFAKNAHPWARIVVTVIQAVKKYWPLFGAFALGILLLMSHVGNITLFGTSEEEEQMKIALEEQKYREAYETLITKTHDTVREAYADFVETDAYPRGYALRDTYDYPVSSETITETDEDQNQLIQNYTYENNIGVVVSPSVNSLTVSLDVAYEMLARYQYIMYYVGENYNKPGFNDTYKDEPISPDKPQDYTKAFLKLVKECIKYSKSTNKFFSITVSPPTVYENEEIINETTEEYDTGETEYVEYTYVEDEWVGTTIYWEAGEDYSGFPAGTILRNASTGQEINISYVWENGTVRLNNGIIYILPNGVVYDGYAYDGGMKIYKDTLMDLQPVTYTVTEERPIMRERTTQDIIKSKNGTITVNVAIQPKVFLKYDYEDGWGNLHRGVDQCIIEQGGNPSRFGALNLAGATDTQSKIVAAANTTPTAGDHMCAAWVYNVYKNAGFDIADDLIGGGDANDMWRELTQYDYNTQREELKPGMLIAVDQAASADSDYWGNLYGHVSIYIGDGKVRSNKTTGGNDSALGAGGTVVNYTLDEWEAAFGFGTIRFGYPPSVFSVVAAEQQNKSTVDKYVQAALVMAADDTIAYDNNANDRNPNVDCGSFITYALRDAGVNITNVFEPNDGLERNIEAVGFVYHTGVADIRPGDVLCNIYKPGIQDGHTEIYLGEMADRSGLWQVGAHGFNSNGNKADEVSICEYYGASYWTGYYRLEGSSATGAFSGVSNVNVDPITKRVLTAIQDIKKWFAGEFGGEITEELYNSMGGGYVNATATGMPMAEVNSQFMSMTTPDDASLSAAAQNYSITLSKLMQAMRLSRYEVGDTDPYLLYLCCCTNINRFVKYGSDIDIIVNFGGGDGNYQPGGSNWNAIQGVPITDAVRKMMYLALTNLCTEAWDCHGIMPENGYFSDGSWGSTVQLGRDAIYVHYDTANLIADCEYYGIWPESAPWVHWNMSQGRDTRNSN